MNLLGLIVRLQSALCGSGLNDNSGRTIITTISMLSIILSTLHIPAVEFAGRLCKVNAPIIPHFTKEGVKP